MKKILSLTNSFVFALFNTVLAQDNRIPAKDFAVFSDDAQFKSYEFTRHSIGDNDIKIEILI